MAPALIVRLIVALSLFAAGLGAGWTIQGWKADARINELRVAHAQTLSTIATKTAEAQGALRKYEQATTHKMAELDQQKTQEIENARLETNRLRRCIAAGTCGVRLNTNAGTTNSRGAADASPSGVDNEAAALHGDLQQRVLDLRDAIAEDSAALEYLQEYAKQCLIGAQAIQ